MTARRWVVALLAALLSMLSCLPARAEVVFADSADVELTLAADGTLTVAQTFTFGSAPGEVTQTLPITRDIDSTSFYRYRISNIAATLDGQAADFSTVEDASQIQLRAKVPIAGELKISYQVTGATRLVQGEHGPVSMLEWPALGGLSVGVTSVTAVLAGAGMPELMDCVAGPPDSVAKCAAVSGGTFDTPEPTFQDGPRNPADEVVVSVAFSPDTVAQTAQIEHHWSLDHAFELSWPSALWALLGAIVGAVILIVLFRRTGVDVAHQGGLTPVGAFEPIGPGESVFRVRDGIRPGHVGTVADERVDPIDITASLLDLAVRGHLRIVELPRSAHGLLDWQLERRAPSDELAPFELTLLDAVAPVGESPLRVSELPAVLSDSIERVQDALYDDVVSRGWFESRPDSTRNAWRWRGYGVLGAALVGAMALVAFTNLGLLALVLLGFGAAALLLADRMPRRTAAGSAMLGGLRAFAAVLATQPTDQMPEGREFCEISQLLGYTVVLGSKERWLEALVSADLDDTLPDPTTLDWYHAPETWHLQDLPASLTQFIHTVQGELFAR